MKKIAEGMIKRLRSQTHPLLEFTPVRGGLD